MNGLNMKTTKTIYDNLPVKNDSITQNHSGICVEFISASRILWVF